MHESLQNDPEFWPSHLCLGVIASFAGNYDKAISSYRRVLEIDENNCYALNNLADIYVDSPPPIFDPERALDYANKTLEIRRGLGSARLIKAEALNRLGRTDEAEPILLELIENRALPTQNHWILYELAIVKSRRGGAISINEIDNMYHIAIANEEREDFIDVLKERAHLFSPKNRIQIKRFIKKTESTR